MTSTTGSPLRSSSALVATVVPIFTLATRAAGIARLRRRARGTAGCRAAPRRRSAPGFSDSSFARCSRPSGSRATMSVKVPPRSIQKSQAAIATPARRANEA